MNQPAGSITHAVGIFRPTTASGPFVVGLLAGEGVGPHLISICVEMLEAIGDIFGLSFETRFGGPIGLDGLREHGDVLPEEVRTFCDGIFAEGGAILAGAGGGRFVYDMRRHFDLFMKLNPLPRFPELSLAAAVRSRPATATDILVVRENLGGLYQGRSQVSGEEGQRHIEHRFECRESDVARLTRIAARIAALRRGHLTVVAKESGLPEMSRLWFDCGRQAAAEYGIELRTLDVDFAVYQFITAPDEFDVLAVPNCFGDILADLGGVLCGARGATYGASYSEQGAAVYQTNHGAAYDLKGKGVANPVGQILSLAMMLNESFGLREEAAAIVRAVRQTWTKGWRTADMMTANCRLAGTAEFSRIVMDNLSRSEPISLSA